MEKHFARCLPMILPQQTWNAQTRPAMSSVHYQEGYAGFHVRWGRFLCCTFLQRKKCLPVMYHMHVVSEAVRAVRREKERQPSSQHSWPTSIIMSILGFEQGLGTTAGEVLGCLDNPKRPSNHVRMQGFELYLVPSIMFPSCRSRLH